VYSGNGGKNFMFLARVPELDFVSQGYTPKDARKNLLENIIGE